MTRRIVVMSYRDMKHPEAGGAEVIMYELFRRIRERGHRITFITGAFPGCERRTEIDGLTTLRTGNTYTFNFAGPLLYRRLAASETVDVVVEDINKIPFFTPAYRPRVPTLAVVPHLFGTTVYREAPWPLATYVYLYERLIPLVYRRCRFSVLSDSTRDDLVARGIDPGRVHVVRAGIDLERHPFRPAAAPAPGPIITYLGRVKKYKAIELVIDALPALRRDVPGVRYRVVGEGDYLGELRRHAERQGVADAVDFLGYRGGADKLAILNDTRVLAYTSPKEGWGLSVIEAGAVGVPSVASDSPGLRESVRDGETGFLVPHADVRVLTERLRVLLTDDGIWSRFSVAARRWAEQFSWDRSADETLSLLERVIADGDGRSAVVG